MQDKRPDPKPKKHPGLWNAYSWYDALIRMRTKSDNRLTSIERGKSKMSPVIEEMMREALNLDGSIKLAQKLMIEQGETTGPIWNWVRSIKGISDDKAAQLLARIDDVGKFDNISSLWRFSGLAVIDGKAERGTQHYNRKLKALLLGPTLIVDQFVRHHTLVYRDHYDAQKERYYSLYPYPICVKCERRAILRGQTWTCPDKCKVNGGFKVLYTPLHIDKMARRKVAKLFISHLWVQWREYERLPVTVPWILREGTGHTTYIEAEKLKIQ